MNTNKLIAELGENFIAGDEDVLSEIIDRVTSVALLSANRRNTETNIKLLEPEIAECAKSVYLLRGAEDVDSREAQGDKSVYRDAYRKLYSQIINHNKRLVL